MTPSPDRPSRQRSPRRGVGLSTSTIHTTGDFMKIHCQALCALLALFAFAFARPAAAQSTDGYHTLQVFPVVVDSSTFTQRFTFSNFHTVPVPVGVRYFPGTGTAQDAVGPLTCPGFTIPADSSLVITSLREMCPGLVSGSAFGFLSLQELSPDTLPFAAHSRVSNFAGNGFSVEAYPPHVFTSGWSGITGLRRLAATGSAPAFQTNCFIANLNEVTASPTPIASTVFMGLYATNGAYLAGGNINLVPGRLFRMLDAFAAVGLPPGDYNDVTAYFTKVKTDPDDLHRPGLMSFCTVQDNTSFGADFRIGKLAYGERGHGANGDTAIRKGWFWNAELAAGDRGNAHAIYFRHPDYVQCELLDPVTLTRMPASAGLEMRLVTNGSVVAGGNNVTGFGEVFLGDKSDLPKGMEREYGLHVESNEQNTAAIKKYGIYCQSGSGHTSPASWFSYTGVGF